MPKHIYMGTDDFEDIRSKSEYLYVDKSLLVKKFIESDDKATLILRPRRFGKSLNFSMLYEFLSNRRGLAVGAPNLFTGLKISEETAFCAVHQNKYPVVFINLKSLETSSLESLISSTNDLIARLFSSYTVECRAAIERLQQSAEDTKKLQLNFTVLVEGRAEQKLLEGSLRFLSECLTTHYGQKVIILIDEYDAVLNFAWREYCKEKRIYHESRLEMPREEQQQWKKKIKEINTFIRHFLGAALKGNTHLAKGLMTGIYPMTKRESASDLNNVRVYSLLQDKYKDFFGFTEGELSWVLALVESHVDPSKLKSWYNGYQAGVAFPISLYNPWSVLTCLQEKMLGPYWEETGNHDLIHDQVLEERDETFKDAVAKLSQGETVSCRLNLSINFEQEERGFESVMATLFYTGYLTLARGTTDTARHIYLLRAPNQEIIDVYEEVIQEWLKKKLPLTHYESFLEYLLSGEVELFAAALNDFLMQSMGVFELTEESNYNIFVGTLLSALKNTHLLYCDSIYSGHGRPDALILPKESRYCCGFVLEYKCVDRAKQSRLRDEGDIDRELKELALTGLRQINRQAYDAHAREFPHVQRILQIGVAFYKKYVVVASQSKLLAESERLSEIEIYFPRKPKEIVGAGIVSEEVPSTEKTERTKRTERTERTESSVVFFRPRTRSQTRASLQLEAASAASDSLEAQAPPEKRANL